MHAARVLILRQPPDEARVLERTLQQAGLTTHLAPPDDLALHLAGAADVVVLYGDRPCDLLEALRQTPGAPPVLLIGPESAEADLYLPEDAGDAEILSAVKLLVRFRHATDARRNSEARLQKILDHAPVAVSVKDDRGRYILVNNSWEEHFQRPRAAVVGKTVHEVFSDGRADALEHRYRAVLTSMAPLEYEEVADGPDGQKTYLKTKFALIEDGAPYAVCGIATDITERKKAEEALRESQALYHSLVETLPVCIFRKDSRGRFTFVNTSFCAELRRRAADILDRRDADFYPEELTAKYTEDDRRVMETGAAFECIEENIAPEGHTRFVQVIKSPLRDAAGRIVGLQGIFWDVTARRRAEMDLARTTADLAVARRVQQRLFPAESSPLIRQAARAGFDLGGVSFSADEIGGDYYDYFPLGPAGLGVAIGDVSGHGIAPALLMCSARAYLRAAARTCSDPGEVLARVNELLRDDIEGDRFITMVLARVDLPARTLVYASAGHATCYVLAGDGTIKRTLASTGVPLGIDQDDRCATSEPIPLEPGDLVVLLTDGIVEARDPAQNLFTAQRVLDLVRVYRQASARQIAENMYHSVRAFAHNLPQVDDKTAMVIKVEPGPTGTQYQGRGIGGPGGT